MRRPLVLAVVGCVIGCSTAAQTAPTQRAIFTGDHGVLMTSAVEGATSDSVAAPPTTVVRALIASYAALGIEATLVDPTGRRVGNPSFSAMRKLAGEPLSTFVKCGSTMTGLHADSDRIEMSMVSAVRPANGTGSEVETRLEAVAINVSGGNSGDRLPCSSTGVLERRLHTEARQKAGS